MFSFCLQVENAPVLFVEYTWHVCGPLCLDLHIWIVVHLIQSEGQFKNIAHFSPTNVASLVETSNLCEQKTDN